MSVDKKYLSLATDIMIGGETKEPARVGSIATKSLFGPQMEFNLLEGFPLLTTKNVPMRWVLIELLWFLRGDTNIRFLIDHGVPIWNEDSYAYFTKVFSDLDYDDLIDSCEDLLSIQAIKEFFNPETQELISYDQYLELLNDMQKLGPLIYQNVYGLKYTLGDCGNQYGRTWRNFGPDGIDQIDNLIQGLKSNPESRRHMVSSIDPGNTEDLALFWCHSMFQFNCTPIIDTMSDNDLISFLDLYGYVNNNQVLFQSDNFDLRKFAKSCSKLPKYYLDCKMYQRSGDMFLGVPFNIASYALLTHIIGKMVNMIPRNFVHTFGDVHIYENHIQAIEEQLSREPFPMPQLDLDALGIDFTIDLDNIINEMIEKSDQFKTGHDKPVLKGYFSHPAIQGDLTTGIQK